MNLKAQPACLQAVPFRDVYETDHPIEAVETADYFLPLAHHLRPGDRLEVVSHGPGVVRFADYMVIRADIESVVVVRIGDLRSCRLTPAAAAPPSEPPPERYIEGDGKVVLKGPRKWCVELDGEEVCRGIADKETALRIATGDLPIPATPEPAA